LKVQTVAMDDHTSTSWNHVNCHAVLNLHEWRHLVKTREN